MRENCAKKILLIFNAIAPIFSLQNLKKFAEYDIILFELHNSTKSTHVTGSSPKVRQWLNF